MKDTTKLLTGFAVAVIVGMGVNAMITDNQQSSSSNNGFFQMVTAQNSGSRPIVGAPIDLTTAAEASIHAVVFIKTVTNARTTTVQARDPFEDFFGDFFGRGRGGGTRERQMEIPKREGIGSGVIISKDGYIVTNNHVVDKSDELIVTLNDKREFKARLIGQDETTDLALIKIDGKDFPTLPIGNSDNLKPGEWVLAVGNPLGLSSTVTAGIVSAKARRLSMGGRGANSIESFIQTDAAINQGNSGGALVNVRGELVGVNAAIVSQTGSYAGYGFAIPTSIMQKVVNDLKEYGIVQRALLGVAGSDNSDEKAKEKDLGVRNGVYIDDVTSGSAAEDAGLKKDDVITEVNGRKINSFADLQEELARHKPGDKVKITYHREKKKNETTVTLKNAQGNTKQIKNVDMEVLGAAFRPITDEVKSRLTLRHGLEVTAVKEGTMKKEGIEKGHIIYTANNQPMRTVEDLEKAFKEASQSPDQVLWIVVINSVGQRKYFAIDLSQNEL